MKIKAFLILASVLLAPVSTSLSAAEKITGAFGVKLGQTLDSQPVDRISPNQTALLKLGQKLDYQFIQGKRSKIKYTYIFYPNKRFRSFSNYIFSITPKTRKIYSISAEGKIRSDSACEKERALIMALLTKKYGEKNPYGPFISQGSNRWVATKCSGLFDVTLSIKYWDSKLKELAENERIELESSNVDSSGL